MNQEKLTDFLKRLDNWINKDFVPAVDKRLEIEKFQEGLLYERIRHLENRQNELVAENIRLLEHEAKRENAELAYEKIKPRLLGQQEIKNGLSFAAVNTNTQAIEQIKQQLSQLASKQAELDQELAWAKNELIRINNNRLEDLKAAITKTTDTKEKEQLLRQKEAIEAQVAELNKIVSSEEKLKQAQARAVELNKKIVESGLNNLPEFEEIIRNPATSSAERKHYVILSKGFLAELGKNSLILPQTINEKGEAVSKDWIQNKLREIEKMSQDAENKRQDKRRNTRPNPRK